MSDNKYRLPWRRLAVVACGVLAGCGPQPEFMNVNVRGSVEQVEIVRSFDGSIKNVIVHSPPPSIEAHDSAHSYFPGVADWSDYTTRINKFLTVKSINTRSRVGPVDRRTDLPTLIVR